MKKSFSRRRYLIYQPPKLKSSSELDKICCLCFTNESLLKLSGYKWNNVNLFEILKYCLPLQDFTDDWHYQSICANCISDLLQTYKFLNKSYQACQIIQKKMSPDYNSESSEKNFQIFENHPNIKIEKEDSDEEEPFTNQINEKFQLLKQKINKKESQKVKEEFNGKDKQKVKSITMQEQSNAGDEFHLNGRMGKGKPVSLPKKKKMNKVYEDESDEEYVISSDNSPVKCKFCILKFDQHELYLKHLKEQHVNKSTSENSNDQVNIFACEQCQEVFASEAEVQEHECHLIDYQCPICMESFASEATLAKHKKKEHKEEDDSSPAMFACEVCEKTFTAKFNLQRHMLCHEGVKPFSCDRCGKQYTQKTNLNLHKKSCLKNTKEPKCKYCLLQFENSCDLRQHIQTEHKIESSDIGPHDRVCKVCNKEFRCRAVLLEHQTIHTGEKNYSCHVCKKRFRLNLHLKTHMLTHTEERKFECESCGMKFKQKSHLMYHWAAIHEGDKRWKCQYCGKGFNLKGNLTVHIRIHTGEAPYICKVCNKGFIDSNRLKKHLKTMHVNDDNAQ